jgi:ornithine cyclodeaminase
LLRAADIRPGTHITAVGSDTAEKIEVEPALLARADVVVVDSLPQSESRGEVFRAAADAAISRNDVLELGAVIGGHAVGRTDRNQITICDLTGVAVQDLQIASAVYEAVAGETDRRTQ